MPGSASLTPTNGHRAESLGMVSILDALRSDYSDENLVAIQVLANDPRFQATECILVVAPLGDLTLADLEPLPRQLRDECDWGVGYIEHLEKSAGGIGASGLEIIALILGIVGTVPTVETILTKIKRQVPALASREEAWATATWTVAMQYTTVQRSSLRSVSEERHTDHWTLSMDLADTGDRFTVEVYGDRLRTCATRVAWIKGHPNQEAPGVAKPHSHGDTAQ